MITTINLVTISITSHSLNFFSCGGKNSLSSFQIYITVLKAQQHLYLEILSRQLEMHFWNKGKLLNFSVCFLLKNRNINTNFLYSHYLLYLWKQNHWDDFVRKNFKVVQSCLLQQPLLPFYAAALASLRPMRACLVILLGAISPFWVSATYIISFPT